MVNRILWNERPNESNMAGDIDEIVLHNPKMVHIEQMTHDTWWIAIYMDGEDDPYWMGNFRAVGGVMTFYEQENNGIEWERDDSHE